jgi:protein-disulfide isomerase
MHFFFYPLTFVTAGVIGLVSATDLSIYSPPVVAVVGNEVIALSELDSQVDVAEAKYKSDQDLYEIRTEFLNKQIDQKILDQEAKSQGISVSELKKNAIEKFLENATNEQLIELFPLDEETRNLIEDKNYFAYFTQQIRETAKEKRDKNITSEFTERIRKPIEEKTNNDLILALRNKYQEERFLMPPNIPVTRRVDLHNPGELVRGAKDAVVTITEFSDFPCESCRAAQKTLQKLSVLYKDEVRWEYRYFPFDEDISSLNFNLAEAAQCAADQGQFWAFHDAVFENINSDEVQPNNIIKTLKIDTKVYNDCLAKDINIARIQKDINKANRLKISDSPMFFINEIPLYGNTDEDTFRRIIDEEIARTKVAGNWGKFFTKYKVLYYSAITSLRMFISNNFS